MAVAHSLAEAAVVAAAGTVPEGRPVVVEVDIHPTAASALLVEAGIQPVANPVHPVAHSLHVQKVSAQ